MELKHGRGRRTCGGRKNRIRIRILPAMKLKRGEEENRPSVAPVKNVLREKEGRKIFEIESESESQEKESESFFTWAKELGFLRFERGIGKRLNVGRKHLEGERMNTWPI